MNFKKTLTNASGTFESKFLFETGRHVWNIVALAGFIALSAGFLGMASHSIESQEERKLSKQIKPVPAVLPEIGDLGSWFRDECKNQIRKRSYSLTKHENICRLLPTPEDRKKYNGVCDYQDWEGNKYKPENKPTGNGCTTAPSVKYSFLDSYRDEYKKEHKVKQDKYLKTLREANSVEAKNNALRAEISPLKFKREANATMSGVVAASGLGVVALSSVVASLLAIERNTRRSTEEQSSS